MPKLPRSKSGVQITDEIAEQLADEAEAGYALTPSKRVGRKSLAGAGGVSPRVNFRMTENFRVVPRPKQRRRARQSARSPARR